MYARGAAVLAVLLFLAPAHGSDCNLPSSVETIAYDHVPEGMKRLLGDIAMPGAEFNAGDVMYPGLPGSRLVAIWRKGRDYAIAIERGRRGRPYSSLYRWRAPDGTALVPEDYFVPCGKLKNIFSRDHIDYRHASGMVMHIAYFGMPAIKARKFADSLIEPVWGTFCSQTSDNCEPMSAYALYVDAAPRYCSVSIIREQSGNIFGKFTWFACSFGEDGRYHLVHASAP